MLPRGLFELKWVCRRIFKGMEFSIKTASPGIEGSKALSWRMPRSCEAILLQCPIYRGMFLERLEGVGGPTERVSHIGP